MTNHFKLTVYIEFMKMENPGLSYHRPKIFFNEGEILAHFYRILNMPKDKKRSKTELLSEYALRRLQRANKYMSLLQDNNWTQADLARHLGVSRAWVTNVLKNGHR